MAGRLIDSAGVTVFEGTAVGIGGAGPVQQVRAPITSPQILDLFNTPVQIVAAPGAGKTIVIVAASFTYLAGGTPYTDNGGTIELYVIVSGGFPQGNSSTPVAGLLDQAVDMCAAGIGDGFVGSAFALSDTADKPLLLAADTASPTNGDGTIIVSVAYAILDTA